MPETETFSIAAASPAQVADDIDRARQLGATEVILDLQTTTCEVDQLIATALDLTADRPAVWAAA